jgi:hypothetical protein
MIEAQRAAADIARITGVLKQEVTRALKNYAQEKKEPKSSSVISGSRNGGGSMITSGHFSFEKEGGPYAYDDSIVFGPLCAG